MYLVIKNIREGALGFNISGSTFDCFACNDPIEVSKMLETGRYTIYKLDGLPRVESIAISTQEKVVDASV